MVQLLLKYKNVHVDVRDRFGQTPLLWAVDYKYNIIVQLLVKHRGININLKDFLSKTPLFIAKVYRDVIII